MIESDEAYARRLQAIEIGLATGDVPRGRVDDYTPLIVSSSCLIYSLFELSES